MKIIYANKRLEAICTDSKATLHFFGDRNLARSLRSRLDAIELAACLRDVIAMPQFRFHNLEGKLKGLFAIDVKTRRDKWRLLLQPLGDDMRPFDPCHIDKVASVCKIIEIMELSPHYE